MPSLSASIDAILVSRSSRPHRCIGYLLSAVVLVDVATAVLLRAAPSLISDRNGTATDVPWQPDHWLQALLNFKSDTMDILLITLLRPLALVACSATAIYVGTPKPGQPPAANGQQCHSCHGGSTTRGATAPLLINEGSNAGATAAAAAPSPGTLSTDVREGHLALNKQTERAALRKNVLLGVMFLLTSSVQVFVGIKCIGFSADWHLRPSLRSAQTILFLSSLVFINLESFLAKRLVMVCTKEEGFHLPEFHPHRLFFVTSRPTARCDLCRNRIAKQAYHCRLCDFDCCAACFNKKDKATSEGIVRGDKGIKHVGALSAGTYLRRGARLMAPEAPIGLVALALLAANSMVRLFMPNFQGSIIQDVVNAHHACVLGHNQTGNATGGDACATHQASFLGNVLIYGGLSFATSLLSALRQLCFTVVARRVILHIRGRVFDSILDQDIAFFDGMRTGDLQQRTSSDVQRMASPLFASLPNLLSNLILLIGGVAMCFATSWRLSMLAFTTVLPITHITRAYAEWSSKINRQIVQDFSDGNAIANEAISNIRTVRAASSEAYERGRYRETLTKGFSKSIKDAAIGALATFFNSGLDLGAGVLILWYGGSIAMEADGEITVGDLITYQLYYNMMNNSIQALSGVLNAFTRAAGAAERVLSVIDLPPDIDPREGAPADVAVRSWDVAFSEVAFVYQMRPTNPVLQGVSFRVPEGTVCALVGPSGGGKSTIIHLLLRFYDPTGGSVSLGGVEYSQLNFPSVHRRTGLVSQDTQLFNTSIKDNLLYGLEADSVSDAEVEDAARAAQALGFITEFEDGMHTKVGERGQRLSGGQRQRIAIARCLLRKPKLLLLDEATSALDAESEAHVQKALDALIWAGSHTVVLVAHRLSTVMNAHKIVVIDKGRSGEQGSHAELLEGDGRYADLVRTQLAHHPAAPSAEPPATTSE